LSIQSNPDLITITAGSTLVAIGGTTATVAIDNNDLTAVKATDNFQATAATVDAGVYDDGTSGMKTFKTYLAAAAAAPSAAGVKVFFDSISSYSVQGNSATATYTDTAVPTNTYVDSIFAVAFVEKNNATSTGRSTLQAATLVLPVKRDANGNDTALLTTAGQDAITIVNGNGGTKTFESLTGAVLTVDQLVAAINGDTTVAGLTVEADRDAFHEQLVTITYVTSDGTAATTSSTAGKLYYTYGTDPETGLPIAGQTADITSQAASGIASAIATALNGDTGAYVATATGATILITAQVSGSTAIDRSPLAHAFNTLSIHAGSPSTTLLLAGNDTDVKASTYAASNTTAIASNYFYLTSPHVLKSGVRVTVKNNSKTVSLPSMAVTVGTGSDAFEGNSSGVGAVAENLTTAMIISSATNSSTLDYVATFSQVESVVPVASTAGTTNRTGWLPAS